MLSLTMGAHIAVLSRTAAVEGISSDLLLPFSSFQQTQQQNKKNSNPPGYETIERTQQNILPHEQKKAQARQKRHRKTSQITGQRGFPATISKNPKSQTKSNWQQTLKKNTHQKGEVLKYLPPSRGSYGKFLGRDIDHRLVPGSRLK